MTTETKVGAVARLEITAHGRGEWSAHERPEGMFVLYAQHASAITALEGEVASERERADKFMWQVRDTCARAEKAERRVAELIARIQSAVTNVAVPKMTESRAEYFKAGARATIAAVNDALTKGSP